MSKLRVQEIAHTNGTVAMTVDAGGNTTVTGNLFRNSIPYIQLLHNGDTAYTAGQTLSVWRVRQSNGISHSDGVLTIPVTGLYHVGLSVITSASSGVHVNINGVNQFRIGYGAAGSGEAWSAISGDCILSLTENDLLKMTIENSTNIYGATNSQTVSSYYCYLIG